MSTKLCKNCASKIPVEAKICPTCGAKFEETIQVEVQEEPYEKDRYQEEPKQDTQTNPFGFQKHGPFYKWLTLVLAIFLGWLGVHKFYERKWIMGALYMVTGGFCGIGIILDILVLLGKPTVYYNYY